MTFQKLTSQSKTPNEGHLKNTDVIDTTPKKLRFWFHTTSTSSPQLISNSISLFSCVYAGNLIKMLTHRRGRQATSVEKQEKGANFKKGSLVLFLVFVWCFFKKKKKKKTAINYTPLFVILGVISFVYALVSFLNPNEDRAQIYNLHRDKNEHSHSHSHNDNHNHQNHNNQMQNNIINHEIVDSFSSFLFLFFF